MIYYFKTVTNELINYILNFLNNNGGYIFIGFDNYGEKTYKLDIDSELKKLSILLNKIQPNCLNFIEIKAKENVIIVDVSKGLERYNYIEQLTSEQAIVNLEEDIKNLNFIYNNHDDLDDYEKRWLSIIKKDLKVLEILRKYIRIYYETDAEVEGESIMSTWESTGIEKEDFDLIKEWYNKEENKWRQNKE